MYVGCTNVRPFEKVMLNRQSNDDVPRTLTPALPTRAPASYDGELRLHTSDITIHIPSKLVFIVVFIAINMSRHDARVCNCVDYNALRQHLAQPDSDARNRSIEQTRNSLLNPSTFSI